MINHFNIAHCILDIGSERQFPITCIGVGEILEIPYIGRKLLVASTSRSMKIESLSRVRNRLVSMEDIELFNFFSCAILLAPTLNVNGSHEFWCTLLAADFDIYIK